jgi:hypothetical protein
MPCFPPPNPQQEIGSIHSRQHASTGMQRYKSNIRTTESNPLFCRFSVSFGNTAFAMSPEPGGCRRELLVPGRIPNPLRALFKMIALGAVIILRCRLPHWVMAWLPGTFTMGARIEPCRSNAFPAGSGAKMRATIACLALLTSSAFVAGPQQTARDPWKSPPTWKVPRCCWIG